MSLGLGGVIVFYSQEDRKRERIVLENTNDAVVVLVVARHCPPHLSRTGLSYRCEIPASSSVEAFPYTFLEVHEEYHRADTAVSAHLFFQSDWSRPESWTSLCPSHFLSCEKLIFGRDDSRTLTVHALKREKEDLAERVRIPFHIHNTRDIAGEASLFALSTYLHSASNLTTPDICFSPDPFLFRRGIEICVGFDGKRLSLDVIMGDRVDEEEGNCWEELRFWHTINHRILEIAQEANGVSDEDILSTVYASLLNLHGFKAAETH